MSNTKRLWTGFLPAVVMAAAVAVIGVQSAARAEPLTPLTPAEDQYLQQLRRVFSANHDPSAVKSDGELLSDGRFVCERRSRGFVGQPTTYMTPAITQLAFIYLCP